MPVGACVGGLMSGRGSKGWAQRPRSCTSPSTRSSCRSSTRCEQQQQEDGGSPACISHHWARVGILVRDSRALGRGCCCCWCPDQVEKFYESQTDDLRQRLFLLKGQLMGRTTKPPASATSTGT